MASRVLLLATKDVHAHTTQRGRPAIASGAELLGALPDAWVDADMTVEDVMCEPSWDLSPASMLAIARRVRSAIAQDGFDGVVVFHGTDTLEESAFLTDLLAGEAALQGGI